MGTPLLTSCSYTTVTGYHQVKCVQQRRVETRPDRKCWVYQSWKQLNCNSQYRNICSNKKNTNYKNLKSKIMEVFRFVPSQLFSSFTRVLIPALIVSVAAMPSPQEIQSRQTQTRFLPSLGNLFQVPQTNSNQGLQNTLAAGGFGGVVGVAGVQCLFGRNCDLNFRPSLGAAVDANGQIVPQLGVTTQVGNGELAPTFTGGLQLDGNSQSGVGTFVGAGINNGDPNSISPGVQTGFGFSQGQNGQTQATAQLGGNVQAPSLAGINFGQEGNRGSVLGAQPHFLGNPFLAGLLGGR